MFGKVKEMAVAQTQSRYYRHDVVRLVAEAELGRDVVRDRVTGQVVTLSPVGQVLAEDFSSESPSTLGQLSEQLADHYGQDEHDIFRDVQAFVASLDDARLIEVDGAASWTVGVRDAIRTRGLSLLTYDVVEFLRGGRSRRLPPTTAGLLRGVMRTQGVFAVLAVVFTAALGLVLGLNFGVEQIFDRAGLRALVAAPAMIGVAHLLLIYIHEGGHMWAARYRGVPVFHVVTVGRKIGVVRQRTDHSSEMFISAAGPFLAAVAGLSSALGLWWTGAFSLGLTSPQGMLANCFLLFGLAHLLSVAPFGEDGVNILRSLAAWRQEAGHRAPTSPAGEDAALVGAGRTSGCCVLEGGNLT